MKEDMEVSMLADKKHLQEWINTGNKKMRADSASIDVLLRTYSESLLHEKVIKNARLFIKDRDIDGFTFNMYQPFYKSCPVGMILDLEIIVDGKIVPRNEIYFLLKGGQRVRLYEARTIQDIWWNIIEPLVVFAAQKGKLPVGTHQFEVTLAELVSQYYEHPKNLIMGSVKTEMRVI